MGRSSKPLTIHISHDLYNATQDEWSALREQGHDIQVIGEHIIDLYLAPYAMRMTPDILRQLPSALELAIKGARTLRYGPQAKDESKWKGGKGSAKNKGPRTRKNTPQPAQDSNTRESTAQRVYQEAYGGQTDSTTSETTNNEGSGET